MLKNIKTRTEQPEKPAFSLLPELPQILLAWYDQSARSLPWRADCLPYHVWLSEIMLQQTRAEVVKAYYTRFLQTIPTLEALAEADEEKLLKLWEGLGYYSRARNLQKAAKMVMTEFGGCFPRTYEQILKLPGVGAYTAGAIASICFGQPVAAVDGNVLRVIARLAGIYEYIDAPDLKKRITASLSAIYPKNRCGDFTQSLIELGATVCLPNGNPKCKVCPVAAFCKALRDNTVLQLPLKPKSKEKKTQQITLFVFSCDGLTAIRRREKKGLLAGMWEFPNVPEKLDEQQATALAEQWGTQPVRLVKSAERVHVFTHIKWFMTCYYFECAKQPDSFVWAENAEFEKTYALPTAFRMFREENQ